MLPSEDTRRWLLTKLAGLWARHRQAFEGAELVQPTAAFFPDEFTPTPEGVATLLQRMIHHSPLADDLPVALGFLDPESCGTGGCGTGSCSPGEKKPSSGLPAPASERETDYLVPVDPGTAGDPVRLTGSLARSVGGLVVLETDDPIDDDFAVQSELAAVLAGFGVLLTNHAHRYKKGCGGVNVLRGTSLELTELAYALAVFVALHRVSPGQARRHLDTTQAEAFDAAVASLRDQRALLDELRQNPEPIARGLFRFAEPANLFGRLLGAMPWRRSSDAELDPSSFSAAPKRVRSAQEMARLREARALVEAALGPENSVGE